MAIAAVQRATNAGIGVTTLSVGAGQGWAAPTSGNLLVITVNVDVVVSTPSGWTAGPSVVDDNAGYLYYKISAGTESTISVPVSSTNGVITACEYSGATATPFDAQNSSTIAASPGTTTTSVSVTTTAAGDLVFAAATLYDFNAAFQPAPTAPSWTNSFTNVLTQDVNPSAARHGCTFVAELTAGAAGAYATAASWSSASMEARHQLSIAFKAAAGGTAFTRTVDDATGLTDTASVASVFARTVNDSAGLTDSAAGVSAFARTVDDAAGLTDALALAQTATVTDTVGLTDATSVQLAAAGTRQIDDNAGLTDTVTYSSTQTRTDTLGLVDVTSLAMAAARAATDVLGLTDSVVVAPTRSVVVTDPVGLTDTAAAQLSSGSTHSRTVNDSIGLTSWHRAVGTTRRPSSGVTARPSQGTTARPSSGVTQRYPLVPD